MGLQSSAFWAGLKAIKSQFKARFGKWGKSYVNLDTIPRENTMPIVKIEPKGEPRGRTAPEWKHSHPSWGHFCSIWTARLRS